MTHAEPCRLAGLRIVPRRKVWQVGPRAIADEEQVSDWLAYGRTHNERRFSPLTDIDTDTIFLGGAVRIGWAEVDGHLVVRVEDEGPGLAQTANLFVPFFTTKPGGSGIGQRKAILRLPGLR